MKLNALPWILIAGMFSLCAWFRFAYVEPTEVAFFCDQGGQTFACAVRRVVIDIFNNGLGYFALALGLVALVVRSGLAGFAAACVGAAGLVLYNWDYAAVAFLVGVTVLARKQFERERNQHRAGQH